MGKKILLADDSLTIQKVMELTLSGTDYELTCVSNGRKAMDAIGASRPDLILADVVMPEKNGYEVCEAVKGDPATASIPVILLSGTFEPFDRERASRIGSDLIVSKPFDAHQLLDQIDALLGQSPRAPAASAREEEAPFETASFDDTLDTRPASGHGGAEEEVSPFGQDHDFKYSAAAVSEPAAPDSPVREATIEEISAEAAEVLFDIPNEPEPPSAAAREPAATPAASVLELSDAQIDRIAARVVEKLSDRIVRDIAWEVVPDLAERAVKRRIEELESTADS